MNRFFKIAAGMLLLGGTLTFSGCSKKDDPTPEIEMEEPDAVKMVFTKLNASGQPTTEVVTVDFGIDAHDHDHDHVATRATDGHDHSAPHIHLDANSSYKLEIQMYRESVMINDEFVKAGDVHQFFFDAIDANGAAVKDFINYAYSDKDKNGKNIGLLGKFDVLRAGEADIRVVLSHGLDKTKIDNKVWNYPGASVIGGDTDMDVTFELHVGDH